ncbi:MAG: tetratricopeptide repeat protein [Myxococcota bacterium]
MIRRRLSALAALLLAAGCVTPIEPLGIEGWSRIATPAFTLTGDLEADEMQALASDLALFDAVVRKVTNTRIAGSKVPIRLYVFRDTEEAHRFVPRGASGVIYPWLDGYFSLLEGGHQAWTRHILLHEYAHFVLMGGRASALPRWYNEGLSEYLAYTVRRDDVVVIGRTSASRIDQIDRFGSVPLDQLFAPPGRWLRNRGAFYGTSWALLHHFNSSNELRPRSRAFVARLAKGVEWRAAFDASFDGDVESLEQSLAAHVAFLRRGGRRDFHLPIDRVDFQETFEPVAVPPAEIAYELGEVARRILGTELDHPYRRVPRALFAQAVAADAEHRRARAALAWCWAADGDFAEADFHLAHLGAGAPTDPVVALDLARVASLRGAPDVGRLFQAAIELDPDSPNAYAALGRHQSATGAYPEAVGSMERARALGGWSPELDLDLARAYLEVQRREDALTLLRPVAADLHGGETAEEARELLAELEAEPQG